MSMSMMHTRATAFTSTGTQQLRAQRPAVRPRLAVVRRATGQGEKQATQKAEDDVEQMAAPEGDRALAGEKAQRGGSGESGEGGAKGAKSTTPPGQEGSKGVANDKDEASKGTN